MAYSDRKLALVTGASSGIGLELARAAAAEGFDLVVAADEPQIDIAAEDLRSTGVTVHAIQTDLSTTEGVDKLCRAVAELGRPLDAILANAGRGLGHGFLDQNWNDIRHVIDTNVTGTTYLLHRLVGDMRTRGQGRILITGSIAGLIPGTYQAVYNASKAYLDNFSYALRKELENTGVTVTVLMPGPTDTEFFERADMLDTKVGQQKKDDPADVAKSGFKAMMAGNADVVAGFMNKVQAATANLTPNSILAEQHRKMAEPGGGKKN